MALKSINVHLTIVSAFWMLTSCVSAPVQNEPGIVENGGSQKDLINFVSENYPKTKFIGAWGEGYSAEEALKAAKIALSYKIESIIVASTSEQAQTLRYGNDEVTHRNMNSSASMTTGFKHAALFREADGSRHKNGELTNVYVVLEKSAFRRDALKDYNKISQDLKARCTRIETSKATNRISLCQDLGAFSRDYDKALGLSYQWNAVLSQDPPGLRTHEACLSKAKQLVAEGAPQKQITINANAISQDNEAKVIAVVQKQCAESGFAALKGNSCKSGYLLTLKDAPVTCRKVILGYSCDYSPLAVLTECSSGAVISQGNIGPFNGLHKNDKIVAQQRMFNGISGQSLGQVERILKQASQGCGESEFAH